MEEIIDQLQQLRAILSTINLTLGLSVAVIVAVLGKIIFSLRRALDFHNEYFVKKRIKRITELQPLIEEARPLRRFLDQSLETEAFKVASGIIASPAKMNALIEINDTGLWTVSHLRNASRHLVVNTTTLKASIKITIADKASAWASLFFTLFLLVVGSGYFVLLAITKSFLGFILGAFIFFVFVIVAYSIAYDFRAYRAARHIEAHLKERHTDDELTTS